MELMKQPQYTPLTVAEMAVSLFAVDQGYVDDVEVGEVVRFEKAMHDFVRSQHQELLDTINRTGEYDDGTEAGLRRAVEDFKAKGTW